MTPDAPCSPSVAFATPHAGEDYFATEAHYLSLAGRLVAALRRGSVFVVLTGDPPPDPLVLSRVLEIAAAWWYAIIVIAREPEISRDQLVRGSPHLAASGAIDWRLQAAEPLPPLTPLFVFDTADGLSEEQIENVYQSLRHHDGIRSAGVLLARTAFLARLEQSNPRLIEDGLIARLRLQELGRDEIETFIRRQWCPGDQQNAFTAEAIAAIADISGGDPALVNHLARLTLEFAALARGKGEEKGINGVDETKAAVANGVEQRPAAEAAASRLPNSPAYHPSSARRVQIGLLLGLAIAGILAVPGDGLLSSAGRSVQSLDLIRLADSRAWINPGPDRPSPATRDNAPQLVDGAAPPTAVDQAKRPRAEAVSVGVIPEHPTGELTAASSTNEAAALQPTPPSDLAELIPNPASAPISALPVATASAALAATTAEPPTPAHATAQPRLSAEDIAALVVRGDAFVVAGDISSARLLYERAVEAGDGRAALRMGATFDPAFLNQANIRSAFGDQRQAHSWYRRARDLGQAEAERRFSEPRPQ
jgi:hypothetical protein